MNVNRLLLFLSILIGWLGISLTPFFDSVSVTSEYDLTKHRLGYPLPIIEQHTSLTPMKNAFPFELGVVSPQENPTRLLVGNYFLLIVIAGSAVYGCLRFMIYTVKKASAMKK
jgi:hypothetical protein